MPCKRGILKGREAWLAETMYPLVEFFYASPFLDMHNLMKEANVLLGRMEKAYVRPHYKKF